MPKGSWNTLRKQVALLRAATASGPDNPGGARSDNKSQAVYMRARELAGSAVEDQSARDELRSMAGSRRKTLERAEKHSRLGRQHLEHSEQANRVHRLLYAALHDNPVAPADPDQLAQIAMLNETFAKERASAEVWDQLLTAQPRLQALLDGTRRGDFGESPGFSVPSADQLADPEQAQRWRESVNGGLRLTAALKHVIGPQAGRSDALTGSERAFVFTDRHLCGERPTPEDSR
jgi:hypothetical protein